MAETTEQKPTAPVKSEEYRQLYIKLLEDFLEELENGILNRKAKPLIYFESIDAADMACKELERDVDEARDDLRFLKNKIEVKRVLGEYANEEHWYFDAGYNQYYPEDHNLRGNEPAQLVLAKLEGEKSATNG